MKITRAQLKETLRTIVNEESEYQSFFKSALEKAGKSIPDMSEDEKKAFFNKIDSAWDAKGEKNEALVGGQKELDIDGDGDIGADDLADLRAGKKKEESVVNNANLKAETTGKGPKINSTDEPENEAKSQRFMLDFYTNSNEKRTAKEINHKTTSLDEAIKTAVSMCKKEKFKYVEIYDKNLFLGSMRDTNGFKFVEGKGYSKFTATY